MLEWSPPRDAGGREDLVYNIICKSCGSGRGACTRCGDNVQFTPRQLGLTEPRVYISDLLAHTQYTFEIQAVNGVTDQSPFSPQFASVNITTNQAGKDLCAHPISSSLIWKAQRPPAHQALWGVVFLSLMKATHETVNTSFVAFHMHGRELAHVQQWHIDMCFTSGAEPARLQIHEGARERQNTNVQEERIDSLRQR